MFRFTSQKGQCSVGTRFREKILPEGMEILFRTCMTFCPPGNTVIPLLLKWNNSIPVLGLIEKGSRKYLLEAAVPAAVLFS